MFQEFRPWLTKTVEDFEQFTVDVVFERREGRAVEIYSRVLAALSHIFSVIVQLRLFLYRNRILPDHHLGCLVVVVGNLTVGGTGKTPVVEKFARSLAERGRKVAIISRGYKSRNEPLIKRWWRAITHVEPPPPKIVSDGQRVLLDSDRAGDEPYMLARNLPGVIVVVDKNRVKAGSYAIKEFGVDTLILDDGFQYLRLKGRLNLLLVDKTNPFGNFRLLPRGILREPVKHLRRASYVFLTKSDGKPNASLEAIIHKHKPDAELIECAHEPKYLEDVGSGERFPLSDLSGQRVGAFCGIADPEGFEQLLTRFGADLASTHRYLDHHRFTSRELEHLFKAFRADGVGCVVTTEKDSVRIGPHFDPGIPFYFLRMEIEILSGVKDFEEAVSRICFPKKKMRTTRRPFPAAGAKE
jgi:tetraacyldisaccharide 4'-kinase